MRRAVSHLQTARRIAPRGREAIPPMPAATIAPLAVPYNARPGPPSPPQPWPASKGGELFLRSSFFPRCALPSDLVGGISDPDVSSSDS